jgi:hypothetical protein
VSGEPIGDGGGGRFWRRFGEWCGWWWWRRIMRSRWWK